MTQQTCTSPDHPGATVTFPQGEPCPLCHARYQWKLECFKRKQNEGNMQRIIKTIRVFLEGEDLIMNAPVNECILCELEYHHDACVVEPSCFDKAEERSQRNVAQEKKMPEQWDSTIDEDWNALRASQTPQNGHRTYGLITDAGHAWVKVPLDEVWSSSVANQISHYSYMDSEYAYLEQDVDAPLFLRTLQGWIDYEERTYEGDAPLKTYPRYHYKQCPDCKYVEGHSWTCGRYRS